MSEFIGARISLISKSDIKYVGTLHEINSENSTVALENVKSFGTEGRRGNPAEEIAPSDQIYEYIVFRGSDVKDLTIIEQPQESKQPQMPNDPAILGSARPPQQQGPPQGPAQGPPQGPGQQWRGPPPPQSFSPYGGYPQQQSRFAPPGGPHGFPGAPGAVPGYGPGPGPNFGGPNGPPPPGWYPPPGHGFPQGPPGGPGGPGNFQQQQGQQIPPSGPSPLQENQRPGPKQPTPSQGQGAQPPPLPTESKPTELSATSAPGATDPSAPPLPKETKSETKVPTEPKVKNQTAPRNSKVAVPLASRQNVQAPKSAAPTQQPGAPQSTQNATQAAAAAVAAAMAKLGPVQGQGKPPGPTGETAESLAQKISNLSTSDSRGRGGQRGVGAPRGGRGPRRGGGAPRHGIEVPTSDFDFESSNAKFNKQDLVKQAIATGSSVGTPDETTDGADGANGINGAAKYDDGDVVIPGANTKKYDKGSSFFDNLSSELKDRQAAEQDGKRLGGSEFRTEERKRNMETFGESSAFRGRGGYRGRGFRGGNRGYGGRGRGGFAAPGGQQTSI
ncbi:hypothetical protein KVT40_008853 [Elsinoe batatas]|uniref:Protein sum2 n=1 Tax=Elsinoe batatas TaxID=2601811 RepID=A0A8K0KUR8_9PEZI|nr:hypothetical protein KVT40_008853 [Elsinoe batatas]